MIKKYEIRWYEYGLTEEKRRRFFTYIGAVLYTKYIEKKEYTKPRIYVWERQS